MQHTLETYLKDPKNSYNNYWLGYEYDKIGQTASAISFYLRAAEISDDEDLQYLCLIKIVHCFSKQGDREDTIYALLNRIIALLPNRPEGYYFLSQYYERHKKWHELYMITNIALKVCNFDNWLKVSDVGYPGKYGILFEKALGTYWIGNINESRDIFIDLYFNYKMNDTFYKIVKNNLKNLWPNVLYFNKEKLKTSKYKFDNFELVDRSYSQVLQDIFVLSVLNGKKNGTYLEIGCYEPFWLNNTYLLQNKFEWDGISIDINEEAVKQFSKVRKKGAICADATQINYFKLLTENNFPKEIDYLQIDCDPEHISYEILTKIPFNEYKFAVITFEHDYYLKKSDVREKSREFLKSKGYELIVSNVSFNKKHSFEDWWVHPDLVDMKRIEKMKSNREINFVEDYFFNITEEINIDDILLKNNKYWREELFEAENELCLKDFNKSLIEIKKEHNESLLEFFQSYLRHRKWIENYREFFSNKIQGDGTPHGECLYYLDLLKDIEENGIKEPIKIIDSKKDEKGGFTILDGAHRIFITKALGHETIKCEKE